MINGHLINHYYIIELFNDLIGKNRFPQSISYSVFSNMINHKRTQFLTLFLFFREDKDLQVEMSNLLYFSTRKFSKNYHMKIMPIYIFISIMCIIFNRI